MRRKGSSSTIQAERCYIWVSIAYLAIKTVQHVTGFGIVSTALKKVIMQDFYVEDLLLELVQFFEEENFQNFGRNHNKGFLIEKTKSKKSRENTKIKLISGDDDENVKILGLQWYQWKIQSLLKWRDFDVQCQQNDRFILNFLGFLIQLDVMSNHCLSQNKRIFEIQLCMFLRYDKFNAIANLSICLPRLMEDFYG